MPECTELIFLCVQGPQAFTLFVVEEPGAEGAEEVASGQEYPILAPEDAASLAAALNQSFAAALAPAAGQQSPELSGLRIEVNNLSLCALRMSSSSYCHPPNSADAYLGLSSKRILSSQRDAGCSSDSQPRRAGQRGCLHSHF